MIAFNTYFSYIFQIYIYVRSFNKMPLIKNLVSSACLLFILSMTKCSNINGFLNNMKINYDNNDYKLKMNTTSRTSTNYTVIPNTTSRTPTNYTVIPNTTSRTPTNYTVIPNDNWQNASGAYSSCILQLF